MICVVERRECGLLWGGKRWEFVIICKDWCVFLRNYLQLTLISYNFATDLAERGRRALAARIKQENMSETLINISVILSVVALLGVVEVIIGN